MRSVYGFNESNIDPSAAVFLAAVIFSCISMSTWAASVSLKTSFFTNLDTLYDASPAAASLSSGIASIHFDAFNAHRKFTFALKSFVIFSDSMSVLQAIESQESKNPLVNRVLQACQEILYNGKFYILLDSESSRYHKKRTCWSCCKSCFIKSTTYTFWTTMYRCFY